jgi:tetratricopeptide (TPR) repeat protein
MTRNRVIIGASLVLVAMAVAYFVWQSVAANSLKQEGLKLARIGDFARAEPILKAALVRAPSDEDVLRALAKGYLDAGRKDLAEEFLTRCLEAAPRDLEALRLRLDLYRELGRFDQANGDADRLIEIEPDNVVWRRKRVAVLYSAGRFADAQNECESSLRRHPGDRDLRFKLSDIKQATGAYAEAGAILDGLLGETPKNVSVLMARAEVHLKQDEPGKAIPLYRKVLDISSPNRPRAALYYLALALNRTGQAKEAGQLMDEVHRMQHADAMLEDSEGQPDNLPLQLRAARAQFESNKLDKAQQIARHILGVDPDYAPAHLLMADILDKQGLPDQAAKHRQLAKEKR